MRVGEIGAYGRDRVLEKLGLCDRKMKRQQCHWLVMSPNIL